MSLEKQNKGNSWSF